MLATIAAIWTVAAVTPGPNFLVTAEAALAGSRRQGLSTAAGVVCGTAVWGTAGALGIGSLFAAAPAAYAALKLLGGLYLMYLGLRLLLSCRRQVPPEAPPPGGGAGGRGAWRRGFFTNLANPKTAAFVAALFATALPQHPTFGQGAGAVLVMLAVSTVWYALVACVFSTPRMKAPYLRARRWINGIAGVLFAAFGARVAFG